MLTDFHNSFYASKFVIKSLLSGNKKLPKRISNSSTEAACLKLIFTKFARSVKKVPLRGCSIVQKIVIEILIEIGRRSSTVLKIVIEN